MSDSDAHDAFDAVVPFSQVTTQPIQWLWDKHLAFGKLAMLDGDPDQGKSYVALDLCARLSTGRCMPDGSPGPGVFSSLILQAEDAADDTTRPRLEALGADLDRVYTWCDLFGSSALQLPEGLDDLTGAIGKTQARFVVLDPIMAFLDPSVTANSDQGVRRALSPFAHFAHEVGVGALNVRHLNKQPGGRAMYRGGGSIGLLAACRSGWLIGTDPILPSRRVLAPIKNNLAGPQPGLSYELVAQEAGPPTVVWHGPCVWSADQVLAAADSGRRSPELDRACEFLTNYLREGPRQVHAVWRASREEAIALKTLERAKKRLHVISSPCYRNGMRQTFWRLHFHPAPHFESTGPSRVDPAIARFLKEQEQLYPPSCPLDDKE